MRAYQIKVKGKNFGVPFIRYNEMTQMLDNLKDYETMTTVQMVEIKAGDSYREGNTIFTDNIVSGVYCTHHPENLKGVTQWQEVQKQ